MGTCVAKSRNGKPIYTSRNYSRNPGKAHAQASNVSPPTQANNATLQQPAERANEPQPATHLPGYSTCIRPVPITHRAGQHRPPMWLQGTRTAQTKAGPKQERPPSAQTVEVEEPRQPPGAHTHAQIPRRMMGAVFESKTISSYITVAQSYCSLMVNSTG